MIYNLINQSENLINEKCKTDTNEKSSDQWETDTKEILIEKVDNAFFN
jgi:hypothetical protein